MKPEVMKGVIVTMTAEVNGQTVALGAALEGNLDADRKKLTLLAFAFHQGAIAGAGSPRRGSHRS